MTEMYFITTLEVEDEKIIASRCVGYFEEYADARKAVCENSCDICETIYNYAVIERLRSGLYPHDQKPHWFKYTGSNSYEEIETPKFAEHLIGFGIG